MKNIYLFCLTFFVLNSITGQDKWGSYDTSIAGTRFVLVENCGDTIVLGRTYEKLYLSDVSNAYLAGGRRVVGDSVFIKDFFNNTEERLLYDYSMDIGDSIQGLWGKFYVIDVQTQEVFGAERKSLILEHETQSYEDIWIEGVGSIKSGYLSAGIPDVIFDAGSLFSCHYSDVNGDWYYANQPSQNCLADQIVSPCLRLNSSDITMPLSLKVFPNPASNNLEIEIKEGLNYDLECKIYDLNGRFILSKNLNQSKRNISVRSLDNGIYILEVQAGSMQEYVKIVVTH